MTVTDTWVDVLGERTAYDFGGRFRMVEGHLRYRRFDGSFTEPLTRVSFERGDAVGVLLYVPDDDAVVLVRQFRYPVYRALAAAGTNPDSRQAWLLEIVAGIHDAELTPREVAHKELIEEAGYRLTGDLEHIATVYASPGGTSERLILFLAEVTGPGYAGHGGLAAEGEDTEVVVLSRAQAMAMVTEGRIQDAKTVIALQYLALKPGRDGGA